MFGPDGIMYFGQGSVSLHGAVEAEGFSVDIAKHPEARDVPGQDVTLTGNNVWSRDPTAPYPYYAQTGPYTCLVPRCGGTLSHAEKDALWVRFSTAAPPRRRRSVAQSRLVKRA